MLRAAALRASNQGQEASALLLAQTRHYFSPISVEFSEDVAGGPKGSKTAPNIVGEWKAAKESTEQTMKLMQMYKDLGDFEGQPYLKFHNPRTFEDMDKPIPNFKKFGLKSGEVPKFFDNVLAKRAGEAVSLKGMWWDARRDAAQRTRAQSRTCKDAYKDHTMTDSTQLKRLAFVQGYASQGCSTLEGVYKTTRSFVPGFVEPYVKQAEETAVSIAAPYFTMAQDTADKLLAGVDCQVDKSLQTLSSALDYSKDLHEKNMNTFNGAKDQYYGFVDGTVDRIKALLDPSPYVQWASGKVEYYVDPDKLVDTTVEYAGMVASFGPVPKVVEIADPLIKTSVKTYGSVHDTVVAMPLYKKVWQLVWSTSGTLQESWPAKKFTEVAYPLLAPLADPVVTNVSNSKYLKQLETHLRPI